LFWENEKPLSYFYVLAVVFPYWRQQKTPQGGAQGLLSNKTGFFFPIFFYIRESVKSDAPTKEKIPPQNDASAHKV
jgi:hypothetical protein